ncbi:MAG: hypothetical protein ABI675_10115 [Chitinophagaceae bacterium]
MKKSFLLLPLVLVAISLTSFAHINSKVDPRAEQAFNKEFAGASNVTWTTAGNFLKASFVWANYQAVAYYNNDAELVVCVRGLFFNQLPLTVIRSVERNFKNADMLEIREITNDDGVNYAIVLEYKNRKYHVRVNSIGEILEQEKLKK